jgi:hypothetical protein
MVIVEPDTDTPVFLKPDRSMMSLGCASRCFERRDQRLAAGHDLGCFRALEQPHRILDRRGPMIGEFIHGNRPL